MAFCIKGTPSPFLSLSWLLVWQYGWYQCRVISSAPWWSLWCFCRHLDGELESLSTACARLSNLVLKFVFMACICIASLLVVSAKLTQQASSFCKDVSCTWDLRCVFEGLKGFIVLYGCCADQPLLGLGNIACWRTATGVTVATCATSWTLISISVASLFGVGVYSFFNDLCAYSFICSGASVCGNLVRPWCYLTIEHLGKEVTRMYFFRQSSGCPRHIVTFAASCV